MKTIEQPTPRCENHPFGDVEYDKDFARRQSVMLQRPFTLEQVIERGIRTTLPDGGFLAVFDSDYRFVVLIASGGIAKQVHLGPLKP